MIDYNKTGNILAAAIAGVTLAMWMTPENHQAVYWPIFTTLNIMMAIAMTICSFGTSKT